MSKLLSADLSGPVLIARVAGEIDLANAGRLREEALALVIDEVDGLILDLTEVPYLDSAGVKVLFDLARALRLRDQSLVVTVPVNSPLRRVLKITGVQEVAPICDNNEAAVELMAQRRGDP